MSDFDGLPTVMIVDALHGIWKRGGSVMPDEDVEAAWQELYARLQKTQPERLPEGKE